MYAQDSKLPDDAQFEAARRAAEYYSKSRLYIHPDWPPDTGVDPLPPGWPSGDGSLGIGECYISKRIFMDGSQAVSRAVRADCNLEAAMGLASGAALLGRPEGSGECALVHEPGDPATDALYAINFAFVGMHDAAAATNNPDYAESARRMAEFFIRTQTQSGRHNELDGTWYRGFDFKKWDYWASDGDAGWGVWTNEIGWTHSWVTATLALRELKTSLWDLTQRSHAGKRFDAVRQLMLPGGH
jgi:hypothetical protein